MTRAQSLLIVAADDARLTILRQVLGGLELVSARSRDEALVLFREHRPLVVVLAQQHAANARGSLPALDILCRLLDLEPATRVIILGDVTDRQWLIEAIGAGAWDVLAPTVSPELLHFAIDRAMELTELERAHRAGAVTAGVSSLPGASPAMVAVCRQAVRVADSDASVVLIGESGTGKEILARALHAAGRRRDRPFVAINCAAIPDALLESELFGYERGAFTGAVRQTPGRIETADHGTLFLDEIGDLPPALQAKILRFLQERVIERVGGRREIAVDVRVICATHRDLAGLIRSGSFREDLFYRLAEIALTLPPLRERSGDAVLLARHFLTLYRTAAAQPLKGFTSAALHALDRHPWPGNVRELQNRVKRAVILANGPRITPEDLDLPDPADPPRDLDLRRRRDEVEVGVLRRALARADGNLTATARLIGVSRPTLYDLLRHHGLRD